MRNVYILMQVAGLVGLMLGPLGIIGGLMLLIWGGVGYRRETRRLRDAKLRVLCPYCRELVYRDAVICPHCLSDLRNIARAA